MKTYEAGIARLIEHVRAMHRNEWSPTSKRKALESIAARIYELADLLDEQGTNQSDIEELHNRPPEPEVGPDGYPVAVDDFGCSYKGTIMYMRDLAKSARRVADELPDPRRKPALPFAAYALLHLRYQHGLERPALSDGGDAVRELRAVCEAAGIHLSSERLRGALAEALHAFDPHFRPYYIDDLLP